MFSPLAFPTGMILYDLSVSVPPTSHLELFPFEIFREPLVIIAIADGAELSRGHEEEAFAETKPSLEAGNVKIPTPDGLGELVQELDIAREIHSRALVHQLLVFDYAGLESLVSGPDDVSWIPRPELCRPTTMKTVLCDITSIFLSELDEFAKTVQAIPTIESPKTSSRGPHLGPELLPRHADRFLRRMTMPAHLLNGSNGVPEVSLNAEHSASTLDENDAPKTFDEIARSIQRASRTPSSASLSSSVVSRKENSRDRGSLSHLSASDRAKNRIKGRCGVVIGSLFLNVGRWPDALKELVEAASTARSGSDYVWHAKALELVLLCLLMFGWAGMDFQVCIMCLPFME